jgi:hypothetical protein
MNSGSQDAGIDPDWDRVEKKWKGNERRRKEGEERERLRKLQGEERSNS